MKVSREKIENVVKDYLKQIFADKLKTEQIKSYMTGKGFSQGQVTRMMNLNQSPEVWNDEHLGVMALAISEQNGLKMSDYYNESEIRVYEEFKTESKKTYEDTMIFENAFQTTENQFMIPAVSIKQIKEYWDGKLIGYDPNIQRELIRKEKNGQVIERMNLSKKKMNEIAEKIVTGKFFSNDIVLNVLKTGLENIKYNEETKKLIINVDENTKVDVIDGAHRLMGFLKAIQLDSNIDFNTSINLSILDKIDAGRLIQQEDMHTPISKSKAKLLGNTNPFLEIAKKINKYGTEETNELFNHFAEDLNEVKINKNKFVTFETFGEAVKYNFFNEDTKISARKIDSTTEFLIKGFNELLGLLKEKLDAEDDIKIIREKGAYLENNMIIGYVALLSDIQHREDWKSIIEKTINSINFAKDNGEWKELEIFSTRLNKTIIRKISTYFIDRSVE